MVIVFTRWTRLAELTSESPDAQRKKPQCQSGEAKEVGPEIAETAALNQGPAHNGRKVMDRVQDGQRLHPFRHAPHGVQYSLQRQHHHTYEKSPQPHSLNH